MKNRASSNAPALRATEPTRRRHRGPARAAIAAAVAMVAVVGSPGPAFADSWGSADAMTDNGSTTGRYGHAAVALSGGEVFVTGGKNGTTVLTGTGTYNPAVSPADWVETDDLLAARWEHTATRLTSTSGCGSQSWCNKVLVVGGRSSSGVLASAELFSSSGTSPASNDEGPTPRCTVSATCPDGLPTTPVNESRYGHTATLLNDGRVLVAGGYNVSGNPVKTAFVYDPTLGTWKKTDEDMLFARARHTATLLASGKVLVTGGWTVGPNPLPDTAEVYDPVADTWTPTGPVLTARANHAAERLDNGQVLVVGGGTFTSDYLQSAELYDPATNAWAPTGSMTIAGRQNHSATRLTGTSCGGATPASWCNKVLVTGGHDKSGVALATSQLYNPATGSWETPAAASLAAARGRHTATAVGDGNVVVTGGLAGAPSARTYLSSAEKYIP